MTLVKGGTRDSVLVAVEGFGGLGEFVTGLVEEFFGASRVAVDVPLVGGAGGGDFVGGLVGEALSGDDVGVPGGDDFVRRGALRDQHACGHDCDGDHAAESWFAKTHEVTVTVKQ